MNLLAFDTSTESASIALLCDDEVDELSQIGSRQHSVILLSLIDQLMKKRSLKFDQLDGIVFGRGPGSFTGIRLACSIAKGLALPFDLPIYPVSSLQAIAHTASEMNKDPYTILSAMDARMQQLYWSFYDETLQSTGEHVSDAINISMPNKSFVLAGVGWENYVEHLNSDLLSKIIQRFVIYPKASAMLALVQQGRIEALSAASALPNYVRNKVAEGGTNG